MTETEARTNTTAWRDEFRTVLDDGRIIRTARIPKRAAKSGRGILRGAAAIIERKGLARGTMRDEQGCRCMYAAILEAAGLGYDLDRPIDTGHIDARQIGGPEAFDRFEHLRDALDLLGQPAAWGSIQSVLPLARFSDESTPQAVIAILRSAADGRTPTWTTETLTDSEAARLPR